MFREKSMTKTLGIIIAIVVLVGIWSVSSYNGLVNKQEAVSLAWGQVQTTYQRRLDLIPNLVATVKGYATHEQSTLVDVVNARAKATQNMPAQAPTDPQQLKQFVDAQAGLSGALSRLMVVVESYPNLKANENFLDLQSQLEGTENRIAVARERFNDAAKTYNVAVRSFPGNIMAAIAGFKEKPYFDAVPQAAEAPQVKF
jgi:LemA protein